MSARTYDLYASPALQGLRQAQDRALEPLLRRCAGEHALLLGVAPQEAILPLPLLADWTRLLWDAGQWRGDLRARGDEALPVQDDSIHLALVRHVLEVSPWRSALLREIVRVLAPGGTLAIVGVHPLGGWSPWMHWRGRGSRLALMAPEQLAHALRRHGLEIGRVARVGGLWPGRPDSPHGNRLLGGGYLLLAGKPRQVAVATRLRPRWATPPPAPANLVPGARRFDIKESARR